VPGQPNLLLHIVRGEQERAELPYPMALLSRVWRFVEHRTALHAPDDLQAFVETDAFTFAEEDQNAEASLDEMVTISRMLEKAKDKKIVYDIQLILEDNARLKHFQMLTTFEDNGGEHPMTRFIERDSRRFIFVGTAPGSMPGAWTHDLTALGKVKASQIEQVREALGASLMISGKMLRRLTEAPKGQLTLGSDAAGMLQGIIAMPLPMGYQYSPSIGFYEEADLFPSGNETREGKGS
jgi:hypothetical protein